MSEIGDFITKKKTLLWFEMESSFTETSKDFMKVTEMVIKSMGDNKNIIKIREATAPFQAREDSLDMPLKGGRHVTEHYSNKPS